MLHHHKQHTQHTQHTHKHTEDAQRRRVLQRQLRRDLWHAIWQYRRHTLGAAALMVAAKFANVGLPLVLRQLINDVAGIDHLALIPVFLVIAYALIRFTGDALGEARDVVFSIVSQQTVASFTARTVSKLHDLGARFHAQRETGTVVRDVQKGADGIGYLLSVGLFTILPALVEIGAVVTIMLTHYATSFTVVIAGTFAIYGVYTRIFTVKRAVVQRAVNRLEAQTDGLLVDSLLNQDTVKYFTAEDIERRRLGTVLDAWVSARLANQKALTRLHVGQSAIIAAGIAAVMLLAVQFAAGHQMSVGDLVLVNAYIIQVCMPLNTLGFVFRETSDAMTNAERMFTLMSTVGHKGEDIDMPEARPLHMSTGKIVFDNVDFGYEPGRRILHGLSFEAAPGKTLAIVGGSGSGKSTLVKLLFRFFAPEHGGIYVDDQNVRDVTQTSLREAIGIVPQDTVLFNDTIAYNIAYGRPGATRSDVVRAARAAQLHEFIERLPDHYDTRVGERGVRLSGGERQRIAIARAILKNPRIIVFDEATSALDTRTERAILNELKQLATGRTSIVVAHRLSTIVDADHILVLEHGRLVEQGSHDALLALNGMYAQLWLLQRQQGELEHAQRKFSAAPVVLDQLAADVAGALQEEGARKDVVLQLVSSHDETLQATADPETLRHAITLLCESEIAKAAPGDRIQLRVERIDNRAMVSVVGERREQPQMAADVGQQAEAALTAVGGNLTVTPVEGRLAYTASVPLRAITLPEARAVEPLTGYDILVVDDEEETRDAFEALLQGYGARVQLAASVAEAIARFDDAPETRPDVILCDRMLGELNGDDLLRRIREREKANAHRDAVPTTVIAMSGYANVPQTDAPDGLHFDAHLVKPVSLHALIDLIHALRPLALV